MDGDGIRVRGLSYSYDGKSNVLSGVDMTVRRGTIYGLLGPSGCGKTTLLKCILGQIQLSGEQGEVVTLGKAPGAPGHSIPGPGSGYMPQDLALESELSVKDCFHFFGRLYGMQRDHVERRMRFLLRFLELGLKRQGQAVSTLSGGQARRLSLSLALLHQPRLLVLDEPTVGIDVVLSAKIWEHLGEFSERGCTCLITTHYIEECRRADTVGLLRAGKMLAEDSPEALIRTHGAASLEAVFLALCRADDGEKEEGEKEEGEQEGEEEERGAEDVLLEDGVADGTGDGGDAAENRVPASGWPRWNMVGGVVYRGLQRLRRNPAFLPFAVGMPVIQIVIFCLAIGPEPKGLSFSVVNEDAGPLGARLVSELQTGDVLKLSELTDWGASVDRVREGDSWGSLLIPENFTTGIIDAAQCEPGWQSDAEMTLAMDMSNSQITLSIEQKVGGALEDTFDLGDAEASIISLDAVYGSTDASFTDFIAPGMISSITYAQSLGLTAVTFVIDKKRGTMDRLWATGVSSLELLLGAFLVQSVMLTIQVSLLLFVALVVFSLPMNGSVVLAFLITAMLGFAGMSYGLVISGVAKEIEHALQMALGSVFPFLLLSGVIWPLQGAPTALRYISYCLPTTWCAESLRSIFVRGWGLEHQQVWMGPVVALVWCTLLLALATRLMAKNR